MLPGRVTFSPCKSHRVLASDGDGIAKELPKVTVMLNAPWFLGEVSSLTYGNSLVHHAKVVHSNVNASLGRSGRDNACDLSACGAVKHSWDNARKHNTFGARILAGCYLVSRPASNHRAKVTFIRLNLRSFFVGMPHARGADGEVQSRISKTAVSPNIGINKWVARAKDDSGHR